MQIIYIVNGSIYYTSVISSLQYMHNIYMTIPNLAMHAASPPKTHANYYHKIEFARAYVKVNHAVSKE